MVFWKIGKQRKRALKIRKKHNFKKIKKFKKSVDILTDLRL